MIKLESITKSYPSKLGKQYIFKALNFTLPTDKSVAILGKNGAGKSTLFRLLASSEFPDRGRIRTDKFISWPVALATGIHPKMTGRENVRFIGRVNGVDDLDEYADKVLSFSGLGQKFDLPVQSYSSGMRSRLAFGACISIDFDVYLIDEVTSVGDQTFRQQAKDALLSKRETSSLLMVSHDINELKLFCDSGVVIKDGTLTYYDHLDEALEIYKSL